MNRSAEMLQFLVRMMASAPSLPLFLIADGKTPYQVVVPPEALGGNPDGIKIVFQQGRVLAQQHPQLCHHRSLFAMQLTLGKSPDGEVVLASFIDQETGDIVAMPYQPVRDSQGRVTRLIDTGGLVQVGGSFLPAFLLGIHTADQPEKQAAQALDREMERLAGKLVKETRQRMDRSDHQR